MDGYKKHDSVALKSGIADKSFAIIKYTYVLGP